jgi:plastocyanin
MVVQNSTDNISIIINNDDGRASDAIAIDSGFIEPNESWQYRFDKEGVFNYLCTIQHRKA